MPSYDKLSGDPTVMKSQGTTLKVGGRGQDTAHSAPIESPASLDATLENTGRILVTDSDNGDLDKTIVRPYPQQTTVPAETYDPAIQADVTSNAYDAYDPEAHFEEPDSIGRGTSALTIIVIAVAVAAVLALGFLALSGRIKLPSFSSGSTNTQQEQVADESTDVQDEEYTYEETYEEPGTWESEDQSIPEYDEAEDSSDVVSTDDTGVTDDAGDTYDTAQDDGDDAIVDYSDDQSYDDQSAGGDAGDDTTQTDESTGA